MGKQRVRKRKFQVRSFEAPEAQLLRGVSAKVDTGDIPGALGDINSQLSNERKPERRAKLLSQVGRTLAKRGRFSEASQAFQQASVSAKNHPREWFSHEKSRIKALIKNVSIGEAATAASQCYAMAETKLVQFRQAQSDAEASLVTTGKFTVPIRPHRLSVVASDLGELFFSEGEFQTAKDFFLKAIANNPRGGTRARQGLAEIALREDDPETAFQKSVEALTLGKFQSKTVASWKPFFAARRKLGQKGLSPEFVASVKGCRPSVRARTTLTIVRELRSANDAQWHQIADEWLRDQGAAFPSVAAELRKLKLAETKITLSDPLQQANAARALMDVPDLAPHEWLSAAKEVVRSSLFSGTNPATNLLISTARRRFGSDFVPQLQHSMALSCMMANRYDLARPLLRSAISATGGSKNHIWSKAQWALGRMESLLKNHVAAAIPFLEIAQSEQVPARFRLQARILWAENLIASGDEKALASCASEIPDMLKDVEDFNLLLNFARQLSQSKGELRNLARQIFDSGVSLAGRALATATHPSQALDVLFKLTRRQVYDFGKSKDVVTAWEGMTEARRLWLWNNDNRWWGYLALVILAYLRSGQRDQAAKLAGDTLDDPATPREALPAVLVPYYEELILHKSIPEALAAFRWIVTENPTRAQCAVAFYWLALDAFASGNNPAAVDFCKSLLAANKHTEVTYDQWMFEAKARLLLSDIEGTPFSDQATQFSEAWRLKARRELNRHLALLAP